MILLRLISWPYFRKHVLRTLLTTAGIVLGVAVFVGMHTANQSVLSAFSQTIDRIAGKTELQVTAGETGFGEDVLDESRRRHGARRRARHRGGRRFASCQAQGNLLVLGIDMTGDRSLRDYDLEAATTPSSTIRWCFSRSPTRSSCRRNSPTEQHRGGQPAAARDRRRREGTSPFAAS